MNTAKTFLTLSLILVSMLNLVGQARLQYQTGFDIRNGFTQSTTFSISTNVTNNPVVTSADLLDIAFSTNGDRFFVVINAELTSGSTDEAIDQYALSTPFDLSSRSSANSFFGLSDFADGVTGILFSTAGDKMGLISTFESGVSSSQDINTYTLTTPFVLNDQTMSSPTAPVFNSNALLRASSPIWSEDGSVFYFLSINRFTNALTDRNVRQIEVDTPFELASRNSNNNFSLNISGSIDNPTSIVLTKDGSKMLVLESSFFDGAPIAAIHQYQLNVPNDLAAGVQYDGLIGLPVSNLFDSGVFTKLLLDDDERKVFLYNSAERRVATYDMNSGSTSGFFSEAPSNTGEVEGFLNIALTGDSFNAPNDTLIYGTDYRIANLPLGLTPNLVVGANDTVVVMTLSGTAAENDNIHDVNELNFTFLDNAFVSSTSGEVTNAIGIDVAVSIDFNDNLAPAFLSPSTASIKEWSTTLAIDVDATDGDGGQADEDITYTITGGADQGMFTINEVNGQLEFTNFPDFENPLDQDMNNAYTVEVTADDGVNTSTQTITITVTDVEDVLIYESSFDLSLEYSDTGESLFLGDISTQDLHFSPDGLKLYIAANTDDRIIEYTLTEAYDLSTATITHELSVAAQDETCQAVTLSPDGTKLFYVGSGNDNIYSYSLATAFDLSTATYDLLALSVAPQDSGPQSIEFSPDGSVLLVLGSTDSDNIYEFILSNPFDLSSVSFPATTLSVSQESIPQDIVFNDDGTRLFLVGSTTNQIYQYDLSTAYDIATATLATTRFNVSQETGGLEKDPTGIAFSSDGTVLYAVGVDQNRIYSFSLPGQEFVETEANQGQVAGSFTVQVAGDRFVETLTAGEAFSISNLPTGLTPNASVSMDGTIATITLNGQATDNTESDGVESLIVTFNNAAFLGGNAASIANAVSFSSGVSIVFMDNNEAPVVDDQAFSLAENSPAGTIVGTIVATDAEGDDLSYSIIAGNQNDAFAISNTDKLVVNEPTALDFEVSPQFIFTVEVSDGTSEDTADITINLTDVDESVLSVEDAKILIYPNPTTRLIKLVLQEKSPVKLLTIDGKLLEERLIKDGEIDLSRFSENNYLLQIQQSGGSYVQRIIKLN